MVILVCGGRDYHDHERVYKVLDEIHRSYTITCIVQGDARGADSLAKSWAIEHDIKHRDFPANWIKYGKNAGPIRNNQMLIEAKPDAVVAFPGGAGTANMTRQAAHAKIPTIIMDKDTGKFL